MVHLNRSRVVNSTAEAIVSGRREGGKQQKPDSQSYILYIYKSPVRREQSCRRRRFQCPPIPRRYIWRLYTLSICVSGSCTAVSLIRIMIIQRYSPA